MKQEQDEFESNGIQDMKLRAMCMLCKLHSVILRFGFFKIMFALYCFVQGKGKDGKEGKDGKGGYSPWTGAGTRDREIAFGYTNCLLLDRNC